jgi:hypothetical protein
MLVERVRPSAEAAEAPRFSSSAVTSGLGVPQRARSGSHLIDHVRSSDMHAIIRSYEGIDQGKTEELARKVNETLLPRLNNLPGFSGYFLLEAEKGVMTSIGLFETSEQADESTRVVSNWVRDEKLEAALPNSPKIAVGKVVAYKTNGTFNKA